MAGEIIKNATILTLDDGDTVIDRGDVVVRDGRIEDVGRDLGPGSGAVLDATGMWLVPGFVQPHVHLCQTLFRGLAEDLPLLDWLRERIWPLEAAHNPDSLAASVRLGIHELLSSGTTAILDMGTVRHTDVILEQVSALGIRALVGKAMMEKGPGIPAPLAEDPSVSLREAIDLASRTTGRVGYVFCPRFLLSVSEILLGEIATEARRLGCRMQTHVSESREECRIVKEATGIESIPYLGRVGLLGPDVVLVHGVHLSDEEISLLAATGTHVVHCPGSNAKLGSGIARIPEMTAAGVPLSLASDGAPCNNNLSAFKEMRLAGQLQSLRLGPGRLDAKTIVRMATRGGARAMGLDSEIGSIEKGKRADLVLLRPSLAHSAASFSDLYTRIVYGMDERNVATVWVDGEKLFDSGRVRGLDEPAVVAEARTQANRLLMRLD